MKAKLQDAVEIIALHAIISSHAGHAIHHVDVVSKAKEVAEYWAKINPDIAKEEA